MLEVAVACSCTRMSLLAVCTKCSSLGSAEGKNCTEEAESGGRGQVHGERWAVTAKGYIPARLDPQESLSPKFLAARKCRNKNTCVANGMPQWECVWEHIPTREQKFTPKGDLQRVR